MTTKAIILAAGKPNFTDCAVSAIQVGGANLLDVQVGTLQRCGINDITVVGGFAFHELRRSDVRLVENKQWETTGSAASLALITDLLDSKSDLIVIYGDTIYSCTNSGVLNCYDAKTGQRLYKQRLGGGRTGFTASPVAADGKIYFASEEGDIYVVQAGPEFKLLAENPMAEICMATPAISEGVLFIRTQKHLVAVGE